MRNQTEGAALFHADRRTDNQTCVRKVTASFRNFANAPEEQIRRNCVPKQGSIRFSANSYLMHEIWIMRKTDLRKSGNNKLTFLTGSKTKC